MNPDPTPCGSNSEDQQGACRESTIDSQEGTGLYLYLGKDDFAKHLVTDEELNEREAERLQAQVAIRTLLQQRVPCLSRSAIQILVDQIDDTSSRINSGEPAESLEFSLRAFDGSTVEMEVETGTIHPNYGGQEVVMAAPFLYYQTYQQLLALSADPREFYPKQASCPLRICYFARSRDPSTKQLLPVLRSNPLEEVRKAFELSLRTWQASEDCRRVEATLRTIRLSGSVSRIVALGNGTISVDDTQRSASQHALILTIRDGLQNLQAGSGVRIQCFAQDPMYTEIDKTILQQVGITVLEDPQALLEVSDESVVLSFGPNIPVRQLVTDLARPVIFICDKVRGEQELLDDWAKRFDPPRTWANVEELEARLGDPESPRLRDLIQSDYEDAGKLHDENFAGACIYIRRPDISISS
ncbi:hypothetical protein FJTKL_05535 [Diaporthe vaccinii]|uniref:SRR1-like domain-containing protein n=1 Tax=Diaporthe vaccinii TaxID=105482 RepID=A0ABR4FGR4_9PEZI